MSERPQPKYKRLFERLHRDIVSGRYKPNQKLPSEAALVKRFGASRITVAHALRELQQRNLIDRIAGSGTYVRGDKKQEALLFGLIIPNLGETEIFEPICQAIAASPDGRGHALLWAHSAAADPIELCDQCIVRDVSGVFFAPLEMSPHSAEINSRVMKRLRSAGIPIVFLDRRPDETSTRDHSDLVGIDNHLAGHLATAHLLRLGARRIGFLAYRRQATTVNSRIRGYRDALTGKASHVFHLSADALPPEATQCDAFVCANDRIAGLLMHRLLQKKLRIPQDIRIVGIDDVNYAALLPVPLTTVHQPCRDIGETALRTMLERLDRPRMPARDILLDCTLTIRKSCGGSQ